MVKARASAGIKPRVFNDEFPGLVIYVDRIEPPGNHLYGILISDTPRLHGCGTRSTRPSGSSSRGKRARR